MQVLNLGKFQIYNCLEIPFKASWFPAGESFVRLETPIKTTRLKILTRLNSSNDILQLMMAVDALRRQGVKHIECLIPYLCYSRQDRMCNLGESFSLKVFANLLNSLKLDKITTFDVHSSISEVLIDNLENIDNSDFIHNVFKTIHQDRLNIICPDFGASKKIYPLLSQFSNYEFNLVICSKERDLKTTEITRTVVPKIENNWYSIIIDDLCDGGLTFLKIAEEMRKNGNS